jgi:hypothetical protein
MVPPSSCSMNDSSLARKSSSDSSSSELSAVLPDEDACASCFINFLHLRSHAVDAVVDGNNTTIREDAGMMDNDMIDADDDVSMSENNNDANNNTTKISASRERNSTTLSLTIARRRNERTADVHNSTTNTAETRRQLKHYHASIVIC